MPREYETTFIVQPEISDEGAKAILARLDGVLASAGSTRLMCEDHGKRKLAYEIKKFHKGHYYTLMYLDGGKVVPEVERSLRLDESILRSTMAIAQRAVPGLFLNAATADLKRDSESMRKFAEVTTCSPGATPRRTS